MVLLGSLRETVWIYEVAESLEEGRPPIDEHVGLHWRSFWSAAMEITRVEPFKRWPVDYLRYFLTGVERVKYMLL